MKHRSGIRASRTNRWFSHIPVKPLQSMVPINRLVSGGFAVGGRKIAVLTVLSRR